MTEEAPPIRTKAARQVRIAQILATRPVASQAELARILAEEGIPTTQATLSRDLVEIHAQKVRSPGGEMVYAVPPEGAGGLLQGVRAPSSPEQLAARFERLCDELVISADRAENLVGMRTPAGAAQYLAAALDQSVMQDLLGSIAGDDTVLVIARTEETAERFLDRVLRLANARPEMDDAPADAPNQGGS